MYQIQNLFLRRDVNECIVQRVCHTLFTCINEYVTLRSRVLTNMPHFVHVYWRVCHTSFTCICYTHYTEDINSSSSQWPTVFKESSSAALCKATFFDPIHQLQFFFWHFFNFFLIIILKSYVYLITCIIVQASAIIQTQVYFRMANLQHTRFFFFFLTIYKQKVAFFLSLQKASVDVNISYD